MTGAPGEGTPHPVWEVALAVGLLVLTLVGTGDPRGPALWTALGAAVLGGAWLTDAVRHGRPRWGGGLFAVAGVLVLGLGLLQLVPLPEWAIGQLDPAGLDLRHAMDVPGGRAPAGLSLAPEDTRLAILGFTLPLVVLLAGPWLLRREGAVDRLLVGVAGVAALAALAGLADWVGVRAGARASGRARGTFLNSNHLADLLTIGFGAALVLAARVDDPVTGRRSGLRDRLRGFLTGEAGPKRTIAVCLAVLAAAGSLATISRGGLVVFVLAATATAWWWGRKRKLLFAAGTVGLFALVLGVTWVGFGEALGARLLDALDLGPGHPVARRADLWSEWLSMTWVHPWTGTGLGSFEAVHPLTRTHGFWTGLGAKYAYHADGDLAEILGELGFVAGGAVVLLVAAGLVRLVGRIVRSDDAGVQAAFPLVAVLGAVLLHEGFDFGLRKAPVNLAFALALVALRGILWPGAGGRDEANAATEEASDDPSGGRRWLREGPALGLAGLVVLGLVGSGGRAVGGRLETRTGRRALEDLEVTPLPEVRNEAYVEARASLGRAQDWDPWASEPAFLLGRAHEVALPAAEVTKPIDVLHRLGEAYREAIRRRPTEGRYHLRLAIHEGRLARVGAALDRVERAVDLDPLRASTLFGAARLHLDLVELAPGRAGWLRARATGLLRKALLLDPRRFTRPAYTLLWRHAEDRDLLEDATPRGEERREALESYLEGVETADEDEGRRGA